jgi:Flp pilus assembly pilin Flp
VKATALIVLAVGLLAILAAIILVGFASTLVGGAVAVLEAITEALNH